MCTFCEQEIFKCRYCEHGYINDIPDQLYRGVVDSVPWCKLFDTPVDNIRKAFGEDQKCPKHSLPAGLNYCQTCGRKLR